MKLRKWMRQGVALFSLVAVILTALPIGFALQKPQEVKAVAVVDDWLFWFFGNILSTTVYMASSAGGSADNNIFTSPQSAGITDMPGAQDYYKEAFTDVNFGKIFQFEDEKQMDFYLLSIASISMASGYLISKDYLKNLWQSMTFEDVKEKALDRTDLDEDIKKKLQSIDDWDEYWGLADPDDAQKIRDALGINDDTYSPTPDNWDIDKWDGLTPEQKIYFGAQSVLEDGSAIPTPEWNADKGRWELEDNRDLEHPKKYYFDENGKPVDITEETYGNGGYDSDSENNDIFDKYIDTDKISNAVNGVLFGALYKLARNLNNAEEVSYTVPKVGNIVKDSEKNDYTVESWKKNNNIVQIVDGVLAAQNPASGITHHTFYNDLDYNITNGNAKEKIIPLVYYADGKPHFCNAVTNFDKFKYLGFNYGQVENSSASWNSETRKNLMFNYITPEDSYNFNYSFEEMNKNIMSNSNLFTADIGKRLDYYFTNRDHIQGANVYAPNVVDVGTKEKAQSFIEDVKSGEMDIEKLKKKYSESGWKKEKNKTWSNLNEKNKGAAVKKVLDSEKGDKYKTKVKDKNGKEHDSVTFGSLVNGSTKKDTSSDKGKKGTDTSVGMYEILGQVETVKPENNNGSSTVTMPTIKPDTDDKNDSSPTAAPSSTKKPTGDSGDDKKDDTKPNEENPKDLDPDEVKTPQLLRKFPFCVPWDVVNMVKSMSAEAVAPKWDIPFVLKNKYINIDEHIIVDFSKFEQWAVIVRWFFRLIFIAGLVILTRYIIKG